VLIYKCTGVVKFSAKVAFLVLGLPDLRAESGRNSGAARRHRLCRRDGESWGWRRSGFMLRPMAGRRSSHHDGDARHDDSDQCRLSHDLGVRSACPIPALFFLRRGHVRIFITTTISRQNPFDRPKSWLSRVLIVFTNLGILMQAPYRKYTRAAARHWHPYPQSNCFAWVDVCRLGRTGRHPACHLERAITWSWQHRPCGIFGGRAGGLIASRAPSSRVCCSCFARR